MTDIKLVTHYKMFLHMGIIIYVHVEEKQQFFFERLLPWDLICMSLSYLSQVSEQLSCSYVYIHVYMSYTIHKCK